MHPGQPANCPFGTVGTADNGCSTSPGGSVQFANFFTGYTGQSYGSVRPAANMACIDYACGMPAVSNSGLGICGLDHIQDPATATQSTTTGTPVCGVIPKGCTYQPNGVSGRTAIGTSTIICGPGISAAVIIKGFEMGAVGGHGATTIYWYNTNQTSLGLKYNHFFADIDSYKNGSFLLMGANVFTDVDYEANTFDGQWFTSFSNWAAFNAFVGGTATGNSPGTATLTVTSLSASGVISIGDKITGSGIPTNTTITACLTGCINSIQGKNGTYTTSASLTLINVTVTISSNYINVSSMDASTNVGTVVPFQCVIGENNACILAQVIGKTGVDCTSDPTDCDNTVGSYSQTILGFWQAPIESVGVPITSFMQASFALQGPQVNTTRTITQKYNAYLSLNSRPTSGQIGPDTNGTPGDEAFDYNYFQDFILTPFDSRIPSTLHGEVFEGTYAALTVSQVMTNREYIGNTSYQSVNAKGPDTTAFAYLDSGTVGSPGQSTGVSMTVTNNLMQNNVAVSRNVGLAGITFAEYGHYINTNTTFTGNYVDPTGSGNPSIKYVGCTNVPQIGSLIGLAATGVNAFTTDPVLSGNFDLTSGTNIDATMFFYSNCGKP